MGIYDFVVKDAKGMLIPMSEFRGKVLLIVNTATKCGFTPQYKAMQRLYERYREQGFEILDFPCNQFGHQAPGTDSDIQQFCTLRYKTTFHLFAKVNVNGADEEPLFRYLKSCKSGFLNDNIKWNFTKFLVSREGEVVERFGSIVKPEKIAGYIERLL